MGGAPPGQCSFDDPLAADSCRSRRRRWSWSTGERAEQAAEDASVRISGDGQPQSVETNQQTEQVEVERAQDEE